MSTNEHNKTIENIYIKFLMDNPDCIKTFQELNICKNSRKIGDIIKFNTYFDQIYVLNLKKRSDRWNKVKSRLDSLSILNYKRFIAIDGSQEPHISEWTRYSKTSLNNYEKKYLKQKAITSPGCLGVLKSMKRILRDAKNNGFSRILIFEDDVIFHKKFLSEFNRIVTGIGSWKLLYLGASQHRWPKEMDINSDQKWYNPIGNTMGAFGVGIHESVYDEIIRQINKWELPFDTGPLCYIQKHNKGRCYVLKPNLVIADVRDSNLRAPRDLKITGKTFRWDLSLYQI
jgi:GR25 family glycosyltransferase involved in LPS biosynthesis